MKKSNEGKQRIVIFCSHFSFYQGGIKFIKELCIQLQKQFAVVIIINHGNTKIIHDFVDSDIPVTVVKKSSTDSMLYWLFLPIMLIRDYLCYKKHLLPEDIILPMTYPSNVIAWMNKLISGHEYFFYCYEPYPFLQNPQFINLLPGIKHWLVKMLSILYSWTDKISTVKAKKVFTLNEITKQMVWDVYQKDAVVTLMGVDSQHFRPHEKNRIKEQHADTVMITHSTDYTEMKRTDLAIDIIAKVKKVYPQVKLFITSTQPNSQNKIKYEKQAQSLGISDNVEFLNFVSYDDLPLYYGASVCYLSTSYDKMLGTTSSNLPVKEAMACGVPALRADITNEDIEDGKSGYLIDPRHSQLAAEKIIYLIKNPKLAKKMGENGRNKIKKFYTWQHVSDIIAEQLV